MIEQKNFEKRLFSSTGLFMDWKLPTEVYSYMESLLYATWGSGVPVWWKQKNCNQELGKYKIE